MTAACIVKKGEQQGYCTWRLKSELVGVTMTISANCQFGSVTEPVQTRQAKNEKESET